MQRSPKLFTPCYTKIKPKKAELALESILADLAVLNIPSEMKLEISLSNHNPEAGERGD
ncbi:hypothetical protein HG267_39100 (plasmid) [Tolypothrix sp. PCC 7601]|nr:hypothetical protein HG267_39100 [Tolypothrix sp. PCC 7601]